MEKMSVEQAYKVMLCFLDEYLSRGNTDVLDFLLLYAGPAGNGRPNDPAAWGDWLTAVKLAESGRYDGLKLGAG
jgi:hypothetical protein